MNDWQEREDQLMELICGPEVEVSPQMKLAQEIRATRTYVEEDDAESSIPS